MANYRRGRINDAVAQELAIALGEVREPKVVNNFISITRAEVAPDLKYATVYFSVVRGRIVSAALHNGFSGSVGNDSTECEAHG